MPNTPPRPLTAQCCLTVGEWQDAQKAIRALELALAAQAGLFAEDGLSPQVGEQLRKQGEHTRSEMAKWDHAARAMWSVIGGLIVGIALIVVNHWWLLPGAASP